MPLRRLLWHGLDSPAGWIGSAAGVLAAMGLIVALHAYERRLISRRLGATLLGLRMAAVLVILLVLLEPVLTRTIDRERTGRLVVAVDASLSMETRDAQATPAEKLSWGRAAGMIGNAEIDTRLGRWIAAYQAGREPDWATVDEEPNPERRALLAAARRDNVQSLLKEIDKLSRRDLVLRMLTGGRTTLLDKLRQQGTVELLTFGGGAVETDEKNLSAALREPSQAVHAQSTDLIQAVRASLARPGQAPLAGVVMFTDGRNTTESPAQEKAIVDGPAGVPIFPVMMGSERRPKDLAIAVLDAPPTVFQHDKPMIRATLHTSGFAGQEIEVQLQRIDQPEAPRVSKKVMADATTANVEFEVDGEELGRRRYRLSTPVLPDETRPDNNERLFTVQIVDDQAEVLLLDGEPRWEFRYIESAFKRDERVKFDVVVFRQPYLGLLPDTFFPRTLPTPTDAPQMANSPFSKYDLVIVGDVTPDQLTEGSWRLLERYVREEGGTLLLTAGKRSFPRGYRSEVIQSLLPVEELRELRLDDPSQTGGPEGRGFQWAITRDGAILDMLKLAAEDAENQTVWSHLPGHSWGLIGRAKPGANVWACLPGDRGAGLDWERSQALLAQQFVGSGQVIWLGVDSTWRWRYLVADRYHHRFWGQLARWSAEFKSSVGNDFVRFGVDRPSVSRGEDVTVRARWDAKLLKRFPNLEARARVLRVDGSDEREVVTVPLKPSTGRPLIFEARVGGLTAGEYRVRLETDHAKVGDAPLAAELLVTEPMTPELADVSANPAWLGQLAQTSNGRLFRPGELDELPRMFEKASETVSTREEVTLWDHWIVLSALFALLTTECVLRKLNGLP